MNIYKLIVLCVFCWGLSGCAGEHYAGNSDYYARTMQSESPTEKGTRYLLGRGVPQSDTKAFEYFLIAADQDDPQAQNEVAYMYAAGKGTPRDYVNAFEYYQKAANQGMPSAEYNLGLLYEHGLGTAKNTAIACQFFQKAAQRGFEPARQRLLESGTCGNPANAYSS